MVGIFNLPATFLQSDKVDNVKNALMKSEFFRRNKNKNLHQETFIQSTKSPNICSQKTIKIKSDFHLTMTFFSLSSGVAFCFCENFVSLPSDDVWKLGEHKTSIGDCKWGKEKERLLDKPVKLKAESILIGKFMMIIIVFHFVCVASLLKTNKD